MSEHAELDFQTLVEEYYKPLYRFGYSLAKNEHEACDLTQQTFAIYAQKGATVRDPSKIKSWLFTTLYREFLRQRRKASNMAPRDPEILEAEAPAIDSGVVESVDGGSAVAALGRIDEAYRAPLVLFYLKDLSYREIAEILEIPIGTVMSRLSRGKVQLKKALLSANPSQHD